MTLPLSKTVKPFLENYCTDCHDDATQKGNLNLDALSLKLSDHANVKQWIKVYNKVKTGQMPPAKKARPAVKDIDAAMGWLSQQLYTVTLQQQKKEGPAVRRLNRTEYENTLHDLLGINTELKDLLPEDGQAEGFDSVADGLSISSVLMEKYLQASDAALGPMQSFMQFSTREERLKRSC